jgi:hypothetical protein
MMDVREVNHRWYSRFDSRAMTLEIDDAGPDGETLTIPAKYEVCDICDGRGKHVNPAIDGHGLSREDFDEDPDFAEAYWRGDYDQTCVECHGERVVPVIDRDRCAPAELAAAEAAENAHYDEQAERAAERRYGC